MNETESDAQASYIYFFLVAGSILARLGVGALCRPHTLRIGSGGSGTDKRDSNCRLTMGVRLPPSGWLKICKLVFINHYGNVSELTDARAPIIMTQKVKNMTY